jgi:hypothetical protein
VLTRKRDDDSVGLSAHGFERAELGVLDHRGVGALLRVLGGHGKSSGEKYAEAREKSKLLHGSSCGETAFVRY